MANVSIRRKSGFIQRAGVMRRETSWSAVTATRTTLVAGTPVLFTGFGADTLAQRPFTIIRVRGYGHIASDQIAASEGYMAHIGLSVVSEQALAIGVTAVPNPVADRGSDLWFVYESFASRILFGDATGFNDGAGVSRTWDSKAMRKVEEGQDVAWVEENEAGTFGGAILTRVGRILIKLH